MPVIVNDGLLSDLLDIQPRTLRAERTSADGNIGNAIRTGEDARQLQHGFAISLRLASTTASEGACRKHGAHSSKHLTAPDLFHAIASSERLCERHTN